MSTINSPIPSLSSEDEKQILENFLKGKILLSDLQRVLAGSITIDFINAPERRIIQNIELDPSIRIPVKKVFLCQMIKKYLLGEITALDLSNWAAFIFMTPFFVPEGRTEDERWQVGEGPVWEIIQNLVSPSIHDGLNSDIANKYLDKLSRYLG